MKAFDKTNGHPFEEPFITLHRQDAEDGDYESASWLRDNVEKALKEGLIVEQYLVLFVQEIKKGGM